MFHSTASTGSISPSQKVGVGYGGVPQGSTASPVQQQSLNAPSYPQQSFPQSSYPASGYPQPVSQAPQPVQPASATYQPYPAAPPSTASVPSYTASVPSQSGNDVAILVGEGETLYSISRRYGIPVNALMQANGISDARTVKAGQRLVVPRYSASQSGWVSNRQPTVAPVTTASTTTRTYSAPPMTTSSTVPQRVSPQPAPAGSGRHTVQPGETLYAISRRYRVPVNTLSAQNGLASPSAIKAGQVLIIPGAGMSSAAPAAPRVASAAVTPAPVAQPIVMNAPSAASQPAVVAQPAPQVQTVAAPVAAPSMQAAGEGFRWPVRGRVISSFGEKSNGTTNDGINIAVPEGTSVRAAENGVVIYAGSELEGFGNLVLVRHANEWVTAYAHNSELMVNRGDTISRGQVIARAGKTGNVSSPQLRFELRKGSKPVDPLKHLNAL